MSGSVRFWAPAADADVAWVLVCRRADYTWRMLPDLVNNVVQPSPVEFATAADARRVARAIGIEPDRYRIEPIRKGQGT